VRSLPSFFSVVLVLAALSLVVPAPVSAQSILENGNFANPSDPLKGWVIDYAFAGNSNYMANKTHVSIATEGQKKVVKFDDGGSAGVKMESHPIPLESGFKYLANLHIKGGGYRIYFAGYQWAPGTHPHDNPELGELRMIYMSKTTTGTSADWKDEKIQLPGVALSDQAIENLKRVRFLTVYIWMAKPGFLDSVTVTKVADPAMNLN